MSAPIPECVARWSSAAIEAGQSHKLDPYLLLAICYRESKGGDALTPAGPGGVGDSGHGHGLMQVDDRSWAEWLATNHWWDPTVNIIKGAEILAGNMERFHDEFLACAAYNCGPGNVRAALKALQLKSPNALPKEQYAAVDARTTGRNYASAVLGFRDAWKPAG